jgi:anti-sigma factor RsiW
MRWRRTPRGISCHELVELVTAYLDGALSAAEATRFEAHLETCPDCSAYVAQFAQTINALGALPAEQLREEMLAPLLDAFRGYVRER